MDQMNTFVALGVGLGLAAAAGFRVFVPLLALGLAARSGVVPLSSGFEWLSTTPALMALTTATALEVLAYYIPWFDNLLDTVSTPAAITAGAVATASMLGALPPWLQWSVAIIGGGGAAGLVKGPAAAVRLKSTALTGGLGNPLVSTGELFGSVFTSILAIALPLLALVLVVILFVVMLFLLYRLTHYFSTPRGVTTS